MSVRKNDPIDHTLEQFTIAGFSYGTIIPKAWFDAQFDIPEPQTVAEVYKSQILYATLMGAFRTKLLVHKKMALRTKAGVGQEVVHPGEQTAWAMSEAKNSISLAIEKASDRLSHVAFDALSDEEQRENVDARAKLSFFKRKGARSLP